MRIPRWLMISLIAVSAVALVAVPAWLWVEMPRRTAAKFIAAIEAGDMKLANTFLSDTKLTMDSSKAIFVRQHAFNLAKMKVVLIPRGLTEIFVGQQKMTVETMSGKEIGLTFYASWRQLVRTDSLLLGAKVAEFEAAVAEIDRAANKAREAAKRAVIQPDLTAPGH